MKHKIKMVIFLFFGIIEQNFLFAQNSFQLIIHTCEDENLYSVIENNIGNYAMVGYRSKASNNNYEAGLVIISDTEGNIIKEKELIKQDTILGFKTIFQKTDGNYICSGKIMKSDESYSNLFICELDNDLNLVRSQQLNIEKNISVSNSLLNSDNNLVFYGEVYDNFPQQSYFFYEMSQNSDSIKMVYDTTLVIDSIKPIMSMLEKKNVNGYYALSEYYDSSGFEHFQILNLNKNFDIIDTEKFTNHVYHYGNFKYFSDTNFIISGRTTSPLYGDVQIGCFITDTATNNIYYENDFGTPDTIDIPARIVSMDFTVKNNIYIAGTHIFDYLNPNPPSAPIYDNYIYIALIDSTLNLKKELFYGGSSGYYVYSVKATSDGGCIVVSSKYDYRLQTYERDAIILKVDSLGNLPASIDEPEIRAHDLILYPNPGNDFLNIRTAVQSIGGSFNLFDITGKQILSQTINRANTCINTANLPSGIYVYRYTLNNKIIETGKWLKQ